MKNVLWLIVGFGVGVIAAQRVGKTPAGKAFFADVETRIQNLSETVVAGYRSGEAEIRAVLSDFAAPAPSHAPAFSSENSNDYEAAGMADEPDFPADDSAAPDDSPETTASPRA